MNAMQYSEISANSTLSLPTRNICQSGDVPCTPLVSTRPLGYSVTYILMPHRQVIKLGLQKFYNLIFFRQFGRLFCGWNDGMCYSVTVWMLDVKVVRQQHHWNVTHLQPWPGSHLFSHLTAGDRSLSHLTISINKITKSSYSGISTVRKLETLSVRRDNHFRNASGNVKIIELWLGIITIKR